MLCPHCQAELDEDGEACPRCHAEFPTRSRNRGGVVKLRLLAVSGAMLMVTTLVLVDCVLNFAPNGRDSGTVAPSSPQASAGPPPNLKTSQAQAQLMMWRNQVQGSQNPVGAIHTKK